MNAHRQIIEPQNGILKIEIPEDMKQVKVFEVFMIEAVNKPHRPKKNTNLAKFKGVLKDLPQEEKEKMDNFFNDIRNEWERTI